MEWILISGLFGKKNSKADQLLPPPPPFPGFEVFEKAAMEKQMREGAQEPIALPPAPATDMMHDSGFDQQMTPQEDASEQFMRTSPSKDKKQKASWVQPDTQFEGFGQQDTMQMPQPKKSLFSKMFSKRERPMPELPAQSHQDIGHEFGPIDDSVHGEIDEAVGTIKTMPSFESPREQTKTSSDEVEQIEEQIHKARLALMDFKFEDAKQIYFDIMRQYQALSTDKKHKVYEDIKDLFYERKNAEKYAAS